MKQTENFRERRLVPIVNNYEKRIGCSFKPNNETYSRLGMNRKRLGLLLSGSAKKPLQVDELEKLSELFGVTINEILNISIN
jgi:hypothetical protein